MRFVQRTLVLGILALLFTAHRAAAVEFAAAKSYPVGTNPAAFVVGDFNGDGKADVAVLNAGSNNLSILLGNGDGTFQAAKNFDLGKSMTGLFAADFNNDGKTDLAVFLPGDPTNLIPGEVRILMGNGDGTFKSPAVTVFTSAAAGLAVGDFNGDKKADLLLSTTDTATQSSVLQAFLGKGDGTFQPPKQTAPAGFNGSIAAVGDFNADGKLDVIIALNQEVQVLLGNADGTFSAGAIAAVSGGFQPSSVLAADLNGDGKMDLVVNSQKQVSEPCLKFPPFSANSTCLRTELQLSVFLGAGNGTFGSELVGSASLAIAIADFNGDGKPDLATGGGAVSLGKGDGSFAAAVSVASLPTGTAFVANDLNSDGRADMISLDSADDAILVLLNESPASGADLGIVGAGPDGATVGQGVNLTYSADVLNQGPQGATNVVFTDTLPAGLTFISASSTVGSCTQAHLVVTCDIGSMPSAAESDITIVVTPPATGTITNTMEVSATQADLAPDNNSASQTNTVVPFYSLSVTKSGTGTGTVKGVTFISLVPLKETIQISCGSTCSATVLSGTRVIMSQAPDGGSFFQGWGGACSGNEACAVTVTGDTTIIAAFVPAATLTVNLSGGGSGTVTSNDGAISCSSAGGTCSNVYPQGTSVSLTAVASGTSKFAGWSGACSGMDPNSCTITMGANESVTATFNPPPDFTLAPTAASLTLKAGSKVSEVLSISSQGGFNAAIALTCSVLGAAPAPSCNISPNSVTPGSNATLTVDASGVSATTFPGIRFRMPGLMPNAYLICLLLGVLAFLLTATISSKQRRPCLLAAIVVLLGVFPAACGSSNGTTPQQVAKNYTVTVTATSGTIQHSTIISVSVD